MGKSAGAAPTSPDPAQLIPLQTAANKETFDYATNASRVNQYSPTGSVTWSKAPGQFDEAGYNAALQQYQTSQATPNRYGSYNGPAGPSQPAPTKDQYTTGGGAWEQTTAFSPDQQKLYDANTQSQLQQSQLLNSMTGQVSQSMAKPTDYSNLPKAGSLSGSYNLNTGMAASPEQQGFASNAGLQNLSQNTIKPGSLPNGGGDPSAYDRYSLAQFNPTQFNPQNASRYGVQNSTQQTPPQANAQTSALSPQAITNAPATTAGGISAPATTAQQGGIASNGKIAAPNSTIQDRSGALSQQLSQYQSQLGQLDPNKFNQQAADAIYGQSTRYLDPQVKQSQQALESRLSEQGFVPGTPGYKQAMENFQSTNAQSYADARDRATTQGVSAGQAANNSSMSAIQAQIAAALGGSNFGLSNDAARAGEGLSLANFASGQNAQDFSQRLSGAQFGANRDDALYGQNLNNAQFDANQANSLYGQNMSNAQFNAAQGQNNFNQQLQGAQFNAGRTDQAFSQGLAGAQFNSQQGQQQFDQGLASANLNINQDQNQFNRGLASANFNAGQNQQDFQNSTTAGNFNVAQDTANFDRQNAAANLSAGLQSQDFNQQSALADRQRQGGLDANAVAQQAFQNQNSATSSNNALSQQAFQNQLSQINQRNTAIAQQQGLDINSAQVQNQLRQQAMAELLQQRSQPLNELNALRSGTQVQAPTGTGTVQTPNMANTDVMGAYNSQYQGQLDAYNAQVGSANSGNATAGGAIGAAAMAAAVFF